MADLTRGRQGARVVLETIDAIVAAEALASVPSVIVTSDARDMRALLDGRPGAERVAIVRV